MQAVLRAGEHRARLLGGVADGNSVVEGLVQVVTGEIQTRLPIGELQGPGSNAPALPPALIHPSA